MESLKKEKRRLETMISDMKQERNFYKFKEQIQDIRDRLNTLIETDNTEEVIKECWSDLMSINKQL
jgi:uncharacterized protein YpuA (DUF1002 family)